MKKFTKFLLALAMLFVLSMQEPFAQTYIEIGNGTTYGTSPSYYAPWGNYWENVKSQTLYLASELGAPTGKKFTQLAWNFERIAASGTNYLNNVTIRFKETTATSLASGAYADMTGATQVFYAAQLVPTTATGWKTFDIDDYIWTGANNLIIEVVWGDNGYWTSTYFRTYKTLGSVNRQIVGYSDTQTPPNYSGISMYYDNMRWYWIPLVPPGNVEGYVFNYDGLSISGANVGIDGGPSTVTGSNGYYLLSNVNGGPQVLNCFKPGYNLYSTTLDILSNQTITHNITLTQPNMVVNPLFVEETLNPNEYYTFSMNVLNNGNGPLDWAAVIEYPETDNGVAPSGDVQKYPGTPFVFTPGSTSDENAWNRTTANDKTISSGTRDVGDVLLSFPAPSPVGLVWGITYDFENLWITDPNLSATTIYEVDVEGAMTGNTINVGLGQSWVGDMASDGEFLYCCLVGGPNTIAVVEIATGTVTSQITGAWTVTSQRGLGYDPNNEEFYIGGWNSNQIWRVDATGATISTFPFNGVSGLEWHPQGGPDAEGSLWVVINAATSTITEVDPNNGWTTLNQFNIPGPTSYSGAGLGLDGSGALWVANQANNTIYLVDTGEPLSGGGAGAWLTMDYYEGSVPGFGGVDNIPTHMDAEGTLPGEVYHASIIFTSTPNVGTITVPVTMIIMGDALIAPADLEVVLTNDITGQVQLTWTFNTDAFQFFLIKRDGQIIGTTTNLSYIDILPTFGEYCYTVQAVYDEGATSPAGPECVEWPNPEIFVNPMSLEGWVWVDHQVTVYTTIYNQGVGTLAYQFPDFMNTTDDTRAYCAASGGCDEYISKVQIGTINNSSACTGYGDYTYLSTEVSAGETYPITITNGNPIWTSDQCGIWVDWNQDEDFTNDGTITVSGSPGVGPYTANITVPDDAEDGPTRMRVRIVYATTPTPCGTSSYGECEDYTLEVSSGFIVKVEPSNGFIASGESQQIAITYDATDYVPGDYFEELLLTSNDFDEPELIIDNTMHVYMPGQYAGMVHDNDDGSPLNGVKVTAGPFQTTTDEEGEYSLFVDEGEYDVVFEKLGYMTVTVADTFALQGVVTPISIGMWDMNYAPGWVHAEVMDNDTWCEVTWSLPNGPYEIILDDGESDDYFIWGSAGNRSAVKFTPAEYPATIIGGQFYVGDGNFPGPFLGTSFSVEVYDDDGANGLPGTRLDSNAVTVNNYGWVSLDWMNATIEDGSFYLCMLQTAGAPNAAPIGVDTDNPTYFRSYILFSGSPEWVLSPLQDFMIRAWVYGPEGDAVMASANNEKVWRAVPKVPANWQNYAQTASGTLPRILPGYERNDASFRGVAGMSNRDVQNYRVARYSQFNPDLPINPPTNGTLTELATTGNQHYNDIAWGGLPMGWYAYGVKALYTSGIYSSYTISNIVGHLFDYQVTVNVTLSTGEEPINCEVTLKSKEYPYEDYFAVTPGSGTVVFDQVWRGHYDVCAFKIGYDVYCIENAFINSDKVYNIMLGEKKYPPTCLVVDPVSLEATWCEPLRTAVSVDFEEPVFPPVGWQVLTQGLGAGWERTDDGSSGGWVIPSWDSFYAMSNDDAAGSDSDGCCDYLITPPMDLRESEGYMLSFDSFYDGLYGQLAFVEYSTDGGATWEVLEQMQPATSWGSVEIDLAMFSGLAGPAQLWFAFHSDDAGQYASGWAIDNVKVQVPSPAANYIDFWVFLDNAFEGVTTETNWNYAPLWYGDTYTASVAARYTSGLSAKDYYTFFCEYLFPPDSLRGEAPDDAAILTWMPPLEYYPTVLSASDGPKYSKSVSEFIPGTLSDASAFSRSEAGDIPVSTTGTRDVGDVLYQFGAPSPIGLVWGICDDGTNLWISDPNLSATTIYKVTYEGVNTGETITISQGQSWVGDMVSDGTFLYGCLVGGPNTIVQVDIASGTTIGTITGAWTVTSQRGLGADFINEEFYIGGWNSNQIWRTDFTGATIGTFGFNGVSGLAWHPAGGPAQEGALWVMVNAASNLVTEVDPNAGWATIQSFMIPGGQQYSGAGLEISLNGDYTPGALWVPNQVDNQVYLVETGEDLNIVPTPEMPENLEGYNVYRDMEFVAYTAHTPEEEYVLQSYVDEGLQPGIYQYSVTAVYDLARYGFPGETGESMHEGPWEVIVDYCYELEFMETWSMGNFDNNNWLTDGTNWSINGQAGNPMPAAEFTWDPIQTDYELALTSYPLCAVGMTEGIVWLDFDLKLVSVQPTGEEMLQVQVWNWDTKVWNTVKEYSNADGNFGWTSEHVNIKSQAMNKVFKVRFNAVGVNSLNILSWFVDNIHIYRACEGITELTLTTPNTGMLLTWQGPDPGTIDKWIQWDDGVWAENSIGTGQAVQFDVAHRWEPAQLAEYEGAALTEIAFVPCEPLCTYNVRVWIGAGAANLVVDQAVANPVMNEWNYVTLNTPVPLDVTQELWIGYYVDAQTGYPAGVDNGPAIDGYGNMMNYGGWQTLLEINDQLNFNWNISGHLQTVTGVTMPLGKSVEPVSTPVTTLSVKNHAGQGQSVFAPASGSRDLTGYNIYRSIDGAPYELIDFTPEASYLDTEENPVIGGFYCYMVTAVWESDIDQCESAFSSEECAIWTSIGDGEGSAGDSFSLYPNPADDHVFITTSDELQRVTVYNALGQLVIDEITTGKQYELNTAAYTIGVYMVRVETSAGVTTRTLTVQR